MIYKAFRALPVLTNVQKTAEKELDFLHFSQDQHLAEKKEKSRKPLSLLDFLAERMGFEPMCDCSQTDFESSGKNRTWRNLTEDNGRCENPENAVFSWLFAPVRIENAVKIRV